MLLTILFFLAYYIAFGPHGPRRPPPPDEGRNVFFLSAGVICAAFAIFAFTRMFASPIRPRTMTKEWQEASEEYLKVRCYVTAVAVYLSCDIPLTRHRLKDPSPSLPTRACWFSLNPRRTFLLGRSSTTSRQFHSRHHSVHTVPIPIPYFLGSAFDWYRLCAIYRKIGELRAAA
jgi:hypothetical protein